MNPTIIERPNVTQFSVNVFAIYRFSEKSDSKDLIISGCMKIRNIRTQQKKVINGAAHQLKKK